MRLARAMWNASKSPVKCACLPHAHAAHHSSRFDLQRVVAARRFMLVSVKLHHCLCVDMHERHWSAALPAMIVSGVKSAGMVVADLFHPVVR